MNDQAKKKIIVVRKHSADRWFSTLAMFFSILLILIGLVTLVAIQKPLQESQENRPKASLDSGKVIVQAVPTSQIIEKQPATINITVNTNGLQTDGIQLIFDVNSNVISEPSVDLYSDTGLTASYQEVEKTSSGYKVGLIAAKPGSTFSSTRNVNVAKITFVPSAVGSLTFDFDPETSIATVHGTNPPQDELKTIADTTFSITAAEDTTATDDLFINADKVKLMFYTIGGREISASELKTNEPFKLRINYAIKNTLGSSATKNKNLTVIYYLNGVGKSTSTVNYQLIDNTDNSYPLSFDVTFANGVTNGTLNHQILIDATNQVHETNENNNGWTGTSKFSDAGTTSDSSTSVKSCNQTCNNHHECPVNQACFEIDGQKRCRLVNNINDDKCQNPGDFGLNRTCNEYCADSRECKSNFTCYYNRCRQPGNPESTSCAVTTASVAQAMVNGCNKTCQTNRDCAMNLRCYNNQCRLATNVGSLTCTPATKRTVTQYLAPEESKGEEIVSEKTATTSATAKPSTSSAKVTASPSPIVRPSSSPAATPVVTPIPQEESALQAVITNLRQRGSFFPIAMIASGLGMMVLIIVLFLLSRTKINKPQKPLVQATPVQKQQMQSLEQKIKALETQPTTPAPTPIVMPPVTAPPVVAPPVVKPTVLSYQPPTPMTQPISRPVPVAAPMPVTPKPVVIPTNQPTPQMPAAPIAAKPMTMVEKLKMRGVTVPEDRNKT